MNFRRLGMEIMRRARPTRKCFWVALHFASQEEADRWLEERATTSERLDARQLQTGNRIRHCDV